MAGLMTERDVMMLYCNHQRRDAAGANAYPRQSLYWPKMLLFVTLPYQKGSYRIELSGEFV
jgi:hypothetical protein